MILQDLGAEIVKVENPQGGDDSRAFGPFQNGKSAYFMTINRGKKSVSLNLKSAKGKALFLKMAKEFDVVIENFTPGTMDKLGIGYEVLRQENPRVIYAAVSGFGHSGPDAQKPAYDVLVQARGGIMSITGWPGTPPTRVGMSLGDITAALYGAIGILAALQERNRTGIGQKVDIAMLDCQVAILENALARYQIDGVAPEPLGNRHPTISPFQAFRASDGAFVIAVGNDALWQKFCAAMGRADLEGDSRFCSNKARTENIKELVTLLEPLFVQKPVAHWLTLLEGARVPCAPVNSVDRVLEDAQLKARNMFLPVDDPAFPGMMIAGNPIKMSGLSEVNRRPSAPEVGEHNAELLAKLAGISATELAALKSEGVI
jgi:CoA:oxalate CoA-transferase